MKKFEITEEQVRLLKNTSDNLLVDNLLEEWFPEAFKPKLEVGKWYKINNQDGYLLNYQEGEGNCYGFCEDEYRNDYYFDEYHKSVCSEATDEEVKEALVKEAERRGFKEGIEFNKVKYRRNCAAFQDQKLAKVGSNFDFLNNKLYTFGYGRWCVFKNGVWAEIVKEPVTLNYQQIADKFGVDVEQLRISK